ncbi:DUF3073 domain-containing protein [Streptomyces sp. NPDC047108]|uniref:DUF3073 domain-containing protein n=1 Tax=Streptomyces sp. NPDC047108 TaxID=3155025 RepID=UPI00340886C6
MGRGRAKAKQTKVARQLKYNSGGTDLSRLAEELGAAPNSSQPPNGEPLEDEELDDDPYAQYADRYNDEDDEDDDESSEQSAYRRRA